MLGKYVFGRDWPEPKLGKRGQCIVQEPPSSSTLALTAATSGTPSHFTSKTIPLAETIFFAQLTSSLLVTRAGECLGGRHTTTCLLPSLVARREVSALLPGCIIEQHCDYCSG